MSELYSDCQDNFQYNLKWHKFAISDGVGQSFFSNIWSEALVSTFVEHQTISNTEFIETSQVKWFEQTGLQVNQPGVNRIVKRLFKQKTPAYATFAGIQFHDNDRKWKVSIIGDCLVCFIPFNFTDFDSQALLFPPGISADKFGNYPDCLSSIGDNHKGEILEVEGELHEGTFYLMTDALAEWFLRGKENAITQSTSWSTKTDFLNFVNLNRGTKSLKDDDITFMSIQVKGESIKPLKYSSIYTTSLKDLIDTELDSNNVIPDVVFDEAKKQEEKEETIKRIISKKIEKLLKWALLCLYSIKNILRVVLNKTIDVLLKKNKT